MAAPATTSDFLEVCRKSGVIDEGSLSAISGHSATTPMAAAKALIRSGKLTKFQAGQLLAGKYKGLRFDRLKILDRIGAGGMGTVFLCEHLGLRKQVAVKVLPPDQAGDEGVRERFFREARAAAVLDHPNIVRVHDMASSGGVHYIVMEFVDGQDLQSIVNKYGPLPFGKACGYIAQAAVGLQHAFEKGLVHRDIKPANLLVDKDGVVKILDMGLAIFQEEGDNLTAKYDKGAVLGTADYMAPEQIMASSDVDIRADIYSLGVTLYSIINGKPPFSGSCTQKLMAHTAGKATSLTEIRREVPKALSAIVDRMMAKNPADRFQTPTEVVDALTPWLETDTIPIDGQQTRRIPGLPGKSRRHRGLKKSRMPLIIGAAAVSALIFGGLGVWAFSGGDKPDQAAAASNTPPDTIAQAPPSSPSVPPAKKQTPPKTPATPTIDNSSTVQSPRDEAKLVYEIDFAKSSAFSARFDDKKRIGMDGAYPTGWWSQSWRVGATAEILTQDHKGQRCVIMRTNKGDGGSAELHTQSGSPPFKLTAGRRYLLRTEIANVGTQNGNFEVRFDAERPPVKNFTQLKPTRGEWQTMDLRFTAPTHERFGIYYTHARAVAPDYMAIRSVQLFEYPDAPNAPVTPAVPAGTSVVRTIYEMDFSAAPAFRGRMAKPGGLTMDQGRLPDGWNTFVWKEGAAGEVGQETFAGKTGVAIRTISGQASAEMTTHTGRTPKANVQAGKSYRVTVEYAAPGNSGGRLDLRLDDLAKPGTSQVRLNKTGMAWQTVSLDYAIPADKDRGFYAFLSNYGVGAENTLYIRTLRVDELGTATSPTTSYQLNLSGAKSFARRYQGAKVVASQGDGDLPAQWSAHTLKADTLGDVYIEPVGGQPAIGLRNHEGPPSVEIVAKSPLLAAKTGKKYAVRLTYQTEPKGNGHFSISVDGQQLNRTALLTSGNGWKDVEVTVTASANGGLTLAIGCDSVGSESSIHIKAIEVREIS